MRLAFVDTETTGLHPHLGHEVWEVAVVLRDSGEEDEEFCWQIRPDLTPADPQALRVGRFEERFCVPDGFDAAWTTRDGAAFGMSFEDVLFAIQCATEGARLVAANPAFDAWFLGSFLREHGSAPRWHYRLLCVESMTAGALSLEHPLGLRESAETLGVEVDPAATHTARGDARLVRDVYDAALRVASGRQAVTQ